MTSCENSIDRRAVAEQLSATVPTGMKIEYNHDLNVADAFLESYPKIRRAMRDERLMKEFEQYDKEAIRHKRWFHRLGKATLYLGIAPLVSASIRMALGEAAFAPLHDAAVAAEGSGVLAVGLIIWNRFRQHRSKWRRALYFRERVRQWHFQKFLDGNLLTIAAQDPDEYERQLALRWGQFQHELQDGHGLVSEFTRAGSGTGDLYHPVTPYTDDAVAKEAAEALLTLRIEHQLRYSQRKIEAEGETSGLGLEERRTMSEAVASASLAGAIVVGSLAVVVSAVDRWGLPLGLDALALTRQLGGIGLLLAVLSATSRAYRAGYTLPDEVESYEEYCDRIREMKAVFLAVADPKEKMALFQTLEKQAVEELRRFLRMKARATFVF